MDRAIYAGGVMTESLLHKFVYDTTDPLRWVGRVDEVKGRMARIFWHESYVTWVDIKNLSTEVPDDIDHGDKLGPVAT